MVNSDYLPGIEYDMKLIKCAHEYGYELNLESDNMCSLMKFGVLIDGIMR